MDIRRYGDSPLMSQAVVYNGLVHLAGQVSDGRKGTSVAVQTEEILAKVDRLLAEAGSSKQRVLSATIWLRDADRFEEMNGAWLEWIDPDHKPARATVCGVELAAAVYDVEIMIVAAA